MKTIFAAMFMLFSALGHMNPRDSCSGSSDADDLPERLVIIQGKATIDLPEHGPLPATSEILIFKKTDCKSCFVTATVDINGNYKIYVADGKYKIIVRNPSSPEFDMLAPDQERFVNTVYSKDVYDFDIKIRAPR